MIDRAALTPPSLPPTPPPERVLIIKPSAIGDVVHALPILHLARRAWPAAHIAWLVTPMCSNLIEGHPLLSEVIVFDRRRYGRAWRSGVALSELRGFTRELRERQFDLVIDLQGLFRSGYFAWQTGARRQVGMASAREGARAFYTDTVRHPETRSLPVLGGLGGQSSGRHAIERYLDVAGFLGLGRGPVVFPFATTEADRERVGELLAPLPEGRPLAVLLPGTNWETKKWPAARFAGLARRLRDELGLSVVVAGSAGDEAIARAIGPDSSLCGLTTLRQTTALLERAAVVVANDTGPMHIAAALGRPLVAVYGPTDPDRTGPYGREESVLRIDLPCSPCLSRRCSHTTCLAELTEEAVFGAVARAIGGGARLRGSDASGAGGGAG